MVFQTFIRLILFYGIYGVNCHCINYFRLESTFWKGGRDIFFNSLLAYDVADFLLFYKSVQTPASRLSLLLFMFSCLKGFEG